VRRQNFLALILDSEVFPSRCFILRFFKSNSNQQPQDSAVRLVRRPPPPYPRPPRYPPSPPPPSYHSGSPPADHPPSPSYHSGSPPADHPPAHPEPGSHTGVPTRRHSVWDCRAVECIGIVTVAEITSHVTPKDQSPSFLVYTYNRSLLNCILQKNWSSQYNLWVFLAKRYELCYWVWVMVVTFRSYPKLE